MPVPYSEIVNVSIGIAPTPVALPGFGNLLFLTDEVAGHAEVDVSNRVITFSTLAEVTGMFPVGTYPEVAAAANAYYAQEPKPQVFMVGAVLAEAHAGYIAATQAGDLATLQAITAGGFTVTVDALTEEVVTGLDFSAATSLQAVAAIVTANITGATCVYDNGFVITSDTTGAASAVTTLTVDVQDTALALGLLDGMTPTPLVVAGVATETPTIALAECVQFDNTFNEVVTDKKWRDTADAVAVSDFCQGFKKIFGNTTNDAAALTLAGAAATTAGQIDAKSNGRTISSYSANVDEYPSCSVLGRINTVNYQGTNTTLTLMFKKLPTITVADLNTTQKKALESINCNSFLKVGTTSLYSDGRMAGGGWLDTVHGVDWLEKQIQLNVFNLLYTSTTKIPYTDAGIALIVQQVDLALQQAVRNGLVAAGNDSEGNYIPSGYEIISVPITEVSASDKGNRIYNGITFKAVGAGAIHGATITGSFSE